MATSPPPQPSQPLERADERTPDKTATWGDVTPELWAELERRYHRVDDLRAADQLEEPVDL